MDKETFLTLNSFIDIPIKSKINQLSLINFLNTNSLLELKDKHYFESSKEKNINSAISITFFNILFGVITKKIFKFPYRVIYVYLLPFTYISFIYLGYSTYNIYKNIHNFDMKYTERIRKFNSTYNIFDINPDFMYYKEEEITSVEMLRLYKQLRKEMNVGGLK